MSELITSLRAVLGTIVLCCILYMGVILSVGQIFMPDKANGSLLTDSEGNVIGSALVGQNFTSDKYFWGRVSAVEYNASSSGGSNISPMSDKLKIRANEVIVRMKADSSKLIPTDLITASGSGLDPHITLEGALYQAGRVANARNLPEDYVKEIVKKQAIQTGSFLTPVPVVNVLLLNIALDNCFK